MQKYLWGAAALSIAMAAGLYLYAGYVVAHPESILARYSVAAVFSGLNVNPLRDVSHTVVDGSPEPQGQCETTKGTDAPKPEVCTLGDVDEPFAVDLEQADGDFQPGDDTTAEPPVDETDEPIEQWVSELMDQFGQLMREGKFEEARNCALVAKQVDPENEFVQAAFFTASIKCHLQCSGGLERQTGSGDCHYGEFRLQFQVKALSDTVECASRSACCDAAKPYTAAQIGAYLGGWWAVYNEMQEQSQEAGYDDEDQEYGDEGYEDSEDESDDPAEETPTEDIQYHRDHPICPYTGASCPYCPEYTPPQLMIDKPDYQHTGAAATFPKKPLISTSCPYCGACQKVNGDTMDCRPTDVNMPMEIPRIPR